jgi:hypothetical protein
MYLAAMASGALAGPLLSPGVPTGWAVAAGAVVALGVAVSVRGVQVWRERLGVLTAVVAVSLVWSGMLAVLMLITPSCPGGNGARCSLEEVTVWAGIGALFPIAAAGLVSVPVSIAGTTRKFVKTVRGRSVSKERDRRGGAGRTSRSGKPRSSGRG